MFSDMVERIDDYEERLDAITDVLQDLRDQLCTTDPVRDQRIIQEMIEQKRRECNFIIFNFGDSKEAHKSDAKSIKELLTKIKDSDIPFNKNLMKSRMSNKFFDGK